MMILILHLLEGYVRISNLSLVYAKIGVPISISIVSTYNNFLTACTNLTYCFNYDNYINSTTCEFELISI